MTEEFLDEQIIRARKKKAENGAQNIFGDGVSVNNEKLIFREVALFDGKISIMLPDTYAKMEAGTAKLKYPSEQRPQIIWSNAGGDINFAFNLFEEKITNDQIRETMNIFIDALKKVNPSYRFFNSEIEAIGNYQAGWFDFRSSALDGELYNFMFVSTISSNMIHGVFSCPYVGSAAWRPIMKQMLLSLKSCMS